MSKYSFLIVHTSCVLLKAEQLLSGVLVQFPGLWVLDLRRVAGADEDFTLVLTEAVDAILVHLQLQTSLNAVQDAFSELDLFLVNQTLGGWEADWLSSQLRWVALVVKLNEWRTQASFQNFCFSVVDRDLQVP